MRTFSRIPGKTAFVDGADERYVIALVRPRRAERERAWAMQFPGEVYAWPYAPEWPSGAPWVPGSWALIDRSSGRVLGETFSRLADLADELGAEVLR